MLKTDQSDIIPTEEVLPAALFESGVVGDDVEAESFNQPGDMILYHSKWLNALVLKGMDHG